MCEGGGKSGLHPFAARWVERLAEQRRQHQGAGPVGGHGVVLDALRVIGVVGVSHDFRADPIDAPVSLRRRQIVPAVTDTHSGNKTRPVPTAVLVFGLAVHGLRFGELRRPLCRVVLAGFAAEGLDTPHQHAQPRVHRGQTRGAFIDHGLHVRLRRRRIEANVSPRRLAWLCLWVRNFGARRVGNSVLADIHAMDREAPQAVVFALLLFRRQRREMVVEERVDAGREQAELEIRNRRLQIALPVRQGVRVLAFHLVKLVVSAHRRDHAARPPHLLLAHETAAIRNDVIADAKEHQQPFAGRVRIGGRHARDDSGEGCVVAAAQDVDENSFQPFQFLLSDLE